MTTKAAVSKLQRQRIKRAEERVYKDLQEVNRLWTLSAATPITRKVNDDAPDQASE